MTTARTYWTVSWNYVDGDCDSFPSTFDTEEGATAYGQAWADEANHEESIEENPMEATFWVFRHEVSEDGTERVYDDEDKRWSDRDSAQRGQGVG